MSSNNVKRTFAIMSSVAMLSRQIHRLNLTNQRSISTGKILCRKKQINPITRTLNILKNEWKELFTDMGDGGRRIAMTFPSHTDILVIGGGIMGTSIAYWINKKSGPKGPSVTVVEKDPTFSKCSTVLSVGGLRQQFSLAENIQMSLFGADFLRSLKDRFGDDADVGFVPNGYLTLADEDSAEQLLRSHKLQIQLGGNNIILSREELRQKFPWMKVDDIELGCLGMEKEGWFDPWSLLNLMKRGATDLGVRFIHAEATGFEFLENDLLVSGVQEGTYEGCNEAIVRMPDGEEKSITFAICILAGGSETNNIAKLAKIGTGTGILSIPIPVERRKRYVYNFSCQGEIPGISTPMTVDKSGAYFRREDIAGRFICGMSPDPEEEPPTDNLDVDYNYFDQKIWPILADRVPCFNAVKVHSGWGGYYEYNYFDQNGIIGQHPYYCNFFLATGFSGHGIQQAPAVGRAIAELILDGEYKTIDLTRLGFDRFIVNKPMYEIGVV